MYFFADFLHSWLRWLILLAGTAAAVRAYLGMLGNKPYEKMDNALRGSFVGFMHLQLLLGIILYGFASPMMQTVWNSTPAELAMAYPPKNPAPDAVAPTSKMSVIMKNSELRFYVVEHIFVMIAAVTVAQIGSSRVRRMADAAKKHKTTAIFFTIALLLILSRIPWDKVWFKGL